MVSTFNGIGLALLAVRGMNAIAPGGQNRIFGSAHDAGVLAAATPSAGTLKLSASIALANLAGIALPEPVAARTVRAVVNELPSVRPRCLDELLFVLSLVFELLQYGLVFAVRSFGCLRNGSGLHLFHEPRRAHWMRLTLTLPRGAYRRVSGELDHYAPGPRCVVSTPLAKLDAEDVVHFHAPDDRCQTLNRVFVGDFAADQKPRLFPDEVGKGFLVD
ncbi:MAG: hypothetical protein ABSG13_16655 [Bryobacteraceae bacterium]